MWHNPQAADDLEKHAEASASEPRSVVISLEKSTDPVALIGAKAANLAKASSAGLPVVPGLILPVDAAQAYLQAPNPSQDRIVIEWLEATERLSQHADGPLVIRSSSPAEDSANESRAGWYTSVVNVNGREAVKAATREVIESGHGSMAVLAQPLIHAVLSGVLFGADPVTGEQDRLLVAAVSGLPDQLVSGRVTAAHYRLSPHGRVISIEQPDDGAPALADPSALRRLARLARAAAGVFSGPQDIEWAIDAEGKLWLLQSRPITTHRLEPAGPAIFGIAGVDETFPDALAPLEEDLWVPPLAAGIRTVLEITHAVPHRSVVESPVVTTVAGRVVADQELIGNSLRHSRWFDPRPGYRRVTAAWKVGRLRGAVMPLAARALARADRSLLSLPEAEGLDDEELLGALERAGDSLSALHGMEVLMGALLPLANVTGPTGLSAAAGLLARLRPAEELAPEGEKAGSHFDDAALVRQYPALLALLPPRIGERAALPVHGITSVASSAAMADRSVRIAAAPSPASPRESSSPTSAQVALARESLRLRARWVQEAQAVMVGELARRLHRDGVLPTTSLARMLRFAELRAAVRSGVVPDDVATREEQWLDRAVALPDRFRLSVDGTPIPLPAEEGEDAQGTRHGRAGGGGIGRGRVVQDPIEAVVGSVLVVATMDPRLTPLLAGLAGLVAETGSPLSHLAIVARERGVPVVVGLSGARSEFPVGSEVSVNGTTGEVRSLDAALSATAPSENPASDMSVPRGEVSDG